MADEPELGGASSHDMCDSDKQRAEMGTTNVRHDTEQDSTHEGVYGPWVVVTRRKNGTKSQKSGGPSAENRNVFAFKSNGNVEATKRTWINECEDKAGLPSGPPRESKRKLSLFRFVDKAQLEKSIQRIGSGLTSEMQSGTSLRPSSSEPKFIPTWAASAQALLKPNSVKGKKGIARTRASQTAQAGAVEASSAKTSFVQLNKGIVAHKRDVVPVPRASHKHGDRSGGKAGEFLSEISSKFNLDYGMDQHQCQASREAEKNLQASCQRDAVTVPRMGENIGDRSGGNVGEDFSEIPSKGNLEFGMGHHQCQASREFQANDGFQLPYGRTGDGFENDEVHNKLVVQRGSDKGGYEAIQMDFESGGDGGSSV